MRDATETAGNGHENRIRGLIIDPIKREIRELMIPQGYKAIQEAIGGHCFDVVHLGEYGGVEIDIFVDDEGPYRVPQSFFRLGDGQILAGLALAIGCNPATGDSVSLPFGIMACAMLRLVSWCTADEVRQASEAGAFDLRYTSFDSAGRPAETTVIPVRVAAVETNE